MKLFMIRLLSVALVLSGCQSSQSPQQGRAGDPSDCSEQSRSPASLYCQDVFKAQAPIAVAESRTEIRDRLLQVEPKELTAAEMARLWEPLARERDFSRKHDDAFWAALIGFERLQAAKASGTPPVMVFGEVTSFNWLAATRRLREIPKGEFRLDQNLISLVNRDIYTAFDSHMKFLSNEQKSRRFFQYPNRIMEVLNRHFPIFGGKYRLQSLYNLHNVTKPISEGEYRNIMDNRQISGIDFWQMPWSRQGKRFGIFRYPPKEVAIQKMNELLVEVNGRMQAIRERRSSEDPIDLAAEFQWRFVQLHPLVNGNGRTSRALMNRILEEFDLPPSSRREIDVDYTLNLQQQKDLVREGVVESIRLAANERIEGRVSAFRRGFGNRLTTREIQEMTQGVITERNLTNVKELFPQSREQIFELGSQRKKFTLGDDMILHDQYGIPYVLREVQGAIEAHPITDKTYILYGMGGALNGVTGLKRELPTQTLRMLQTHSEFFMNMSRDPSLATRVRVRSYEQVERANNADTFHFYEWQVPMLRDVSRIKEDPITEPLAVLVQNRGHRTDKAFLGRSYVERAFFKNSEASNVAEVIGHYLRTDQFYYELHSHILRSTEPFLEANPRLRSELTSNISESRQKLHTAARTLLQPFLSEVSRLNRADRDYLMNHPQFRLTYEYFLRTPLAYSNLREASRHLNMNNTVVLRSAASSRVALTGFVSDRQVKEFIIGIPFIGPRFETFVRNVHAEVQRLRGDNKDVDLNTPFFARQVAYFGQNNTSLRNAARALLDYIFIHPNASRSMDPEMSRAFVTQYLHTQLDIGPKETLSTTTNPAYLLGPTRDASGNLQAKFAWQDATVYILEVPRESIRVDLSSGFIVQMEVGMAPLSRSESRRAVQFRLAAEEGNVYYLPQAPITPRAQQLMDTLFSLPLPGASTPAPTVAPPPPAASGG